MAFWKAFVKKALLTVLFVAVIVGLYLFTPVRHYLSPEGFGAVQEWLRQQGAWGPLIFGVIYIAAAILSLPGSILTISGGVLFGTAWGTLINLVAATLGASAAFLIARFLGRGFVEKRLKGKLAQLDEKVAVHGFYAVLYLRLIPLFPYNLLNYSFGLSKIPFRKYFMGTLIGMAPGCFIFTSLGGIGRHIRWTEPQTWLDYRVWGPFALVIALIIITKIVRSWQSKRSGMK